MKIQYLVTNQSKYSSKHFSVTGEGSIEEECYEDAIKKAKEIYPLNTDFNLQRVAIISA